MSPRLDLLLTNHPALACCRDRVLEAYQLLERCYAADGKLLLCGNGGSASDADHISGELLKGFQSLRPLPPADQERLGQPLGSRLQQGLAAIPLTAFPALSTAFNNDVHGDATFAQLVWALGRPGDVLLGISTSGNSVGVGHALRAARARGMRTLGLSGESGGAMRELCDVCICVPSRETFRIQEYHLPIYHTLCLMLEDRFFG